MFCGFSFSILGSGFSVLFSVFSTFWHFQIALTSNNVIRTFMLLQKHFMQLQKTTHTLVFKNSRTRSMHCSAVPSGLSNCHRRTSDVISLIHGPGFL